MAMHPMAWGRSMQSERVKRGAALAAMILGSLGLLVCLIAIIASWWVRSELTAQADAGLAGLEQAVELGASGLERIGGAISLTQTRTESLRQRLAPLAQTGAPSQEDQSRLVASVAELGTSYASMRERYLAAREQVTALLKLAQTTRRIPFVSIPEIPVAQLEAIDARLAEVDQALATLQSRVNLDTAALNAGLSQAREAAGTLDTRLVALNASVLSLQERLGGLHDAVTSSRAALPSWMSWAYSALTLGLLWIGFLHLSLFGHGWFFWQSSR